MNPLARVGVLALVVVAGLAIAYYVVPIGVAIISLGELCPYSPAGINLCGEDSGVADQAAENSRTPSPRQPLCRKADGVRYVGTTPQGADVCFTVTRDGMSWTEVGFTFVRASRCPHAPASIYSTGRTYIEGPGQLTPSDHISVPGFTATIRGPAASGVLSDSEVCGTKTFTWRARRVGR